MGSKVLLKGWISKILSFWGYELRKKSERRQHSPGFSIQKELSTTQSPVIFDVGANVGDISILYRNLFPEAKIYSFEPSPDSFSVLKEKVSEDNEIYVFPYAIAEDSGKSILHQNSQPSTNSLLPTHSDGVSYWGDGLLETQNTVEVSTVSIDDFCKENSIDHIDILKLDIQGFEYPALLGARNMLQGKKISLIYSEIIVVPTYEKQHKFHEYLSFFDSYDYNFYNLYNPKQQGGQLNQADFLFIATENYTT